MSWAKTDTTNYSNIANKLRIQKPNETFLPSEMDDAIDDINGDIADAYTACQSKGATLPQSQISANLAGTIQNIPERNTLDECLTDTLEVANLPNATFILSYLFQHNRNLVNVIMPNVTSIGAAAFDGCINLALTSLPNGVTSIGTAAFNGCANLALTSLPNGVTRILYQVFNGCRNLALTSLPNGVTSIDNYAFGWCTGIPYLDFSNFTQIPTVETLAFTSTTFPFYFRDQQQLDEWAAATNWSTYANRFQIKPSEVI